MVSPEETPPLSVVTHPVWTCPGFYLEQLSCQDLLRVLGHFPYLSSLHIKLPSESC